jgi:hypothetical protein
VVVADDIVAEEALNAIQRVADDSAADVTDMQLFGDVG